MVAHSAVLISRAISSCSGPSNDSNWSFLSVMSTTFGSPATTVAEIGSSVSSARSRGLAARVALGAGASRVGERGYAESHSHHAPLSRAALA